MVCHAVQNNLTKPVGGDPGASPNCMATPTGFSLGDKTMQIQEIWVNVPGFYGDYQISSHGRLKSFKKCVTGKIMSVKNCTGWYLSARLCKSGEAKTYRIHRLVAESFIPNPCKKPEVNHKDFNKQNNLVSNLEWATPSENVRHAMNAKPEIIAGMNYYNQVTRPRTILQFSLDGHHDLINEFSNSTEAEKATGVCHRNILQVASQDEYKPGKTRKQAGGFVWRYKK